LRWDDNLIGNSGLLTKIVHADIALGASYRKCWTAEFIEVCVGLRVADTYANCIKAATPLPLQDFVMYLREHLRAVWRELDGADPRTHAQKPATYNAWMALPLKPSTVQGPVHLLPRYLELELSRHVLRNIARFRLRAHILRIGTVCWQVHNKLCDKCDLYDVQDKKHVQFLCPCLEMCYLRSQTKRRFAEQFADCTGRTYIGETGAFNFDNIGAEDVKLFLLKQTYKSFPFPF